MNYKNAIKDIDGQIKRLEEARGVLVGLSGGRRKGTRTMSAAGRRRIAARLNVNGGRRFAQRRSNLGPCLRLFRQIASELDTPHAGCCGSRALRLLQQYRPMAPRQPYS